MVDGAEVPLLRKEAPSSVLNPVGEGKVNVEGVIAEGGVFDDGRAGKTTDV